MSHNPPTPGCEQPTVDAAVLMPWSEDEDDEDSAIGSEDDDSSTASLNSAVGRYRVHGGRTFESRRGDYWQSNDEKQQDVHDMAHYIHLMLNQEKLLNAPVSNPQQILDVGTGTGIWAIEIADLYPSATVTGIDLSPIQPEFVPPNCKFEIDDATKEWTFEKGYFDIIHIRRLQGAIPDWPLLYNRAYRCLKPGGWIEHTDISAEIITENPIPPDHPYLQWNTFIDIASKKIGKTFNPIGENITWMENGGFCKVETKEFKIPIGQWHNDELLKVVGMWSQVICDQGLEGFALQLGSILSFSPHEMQVFFIKLRQAFKDPNLCAYYHCSTTWAQKPPERHT